MSLELKDVTYVYNPGLSSEHKAVDHVSFKLEKGEFVGLIGHTGSGKSTMIQFLDGLLKPMSGTVLFDGEDVNQKNHPIKSLRQKVGLVFQYPEHQLFEESVFKDVCFGPKNLGLPKEEIEERARYALSLVGFDEEMYDKSPFELSGGQKRRVAIAGILAMKPDFLVLDEPAAGLDPEGKREILDQIRVLNREAGICVVLVSHSMEDVASYAERLLVMSGGKLVYDDTPRNVFRHYKELETMGLSAPQVTYICRALREKGFDIPEDLITVEEAKQAILMALAKKDKIHVN